jgi:uncharacterized protein (TIGR02001 family)
MNSKATSLALRTLGLAVALSAPVAAVQAELAGNIGIHSKYLLRGVVVENDNAAVQGGIDYSHASGFYAGWWGSSLGYSYDASTGGADPDGNGFENDFYAGFAGSAGDLSYKVGLIQYVYVDVDDSDLTEFLANVGYGPFSLQAQYLLNDGWWGNAGDIYWTLNYSTDLPRDFSFGASLGYYTYDDDDNAEMCGGVSGCGITTSNSGFRHLNLTLSHPIGNTGADMYVQYTVAGEDRTGFDDYDNKVIMGLTYGFDI